MYSRMRRMNIALVFLIAAQIVTLNCASTPDAPREPRHAQIAKYGTEIAAGIEKVQDLVGSVGTSSTNQDVKKFADARLADIDKANDAGLELVKVLEAVDGLQPGPEQEAKLDEAKRQVDQLVVLIAQFTNLDERPEFAAGEQLVAAVFQTTNTLLVEIGKLKEGGTQ